MFKDKKINFRNNGNMGNVDDLLDFNLSFDKSADFNQKMLGYNGRSQP